MKTKNSRKGFTIVELVITISVIGVLAAILIPTFISLTQKAEKSSDDSLVTNLNKALAIKETEPGAKANVTFHDAIVDLDEYGYGVAKLITHSDEKLVWNPGDNRFYLEGDEKIAGIPAYKLWGIYDSVPQDQKYSIYPGANWTATTVTGLKVGFDAGDEPVTSISYVGADSAQEVYIRTNSLDTSVTVNAPNDIVWHYDVAGSVNVVSVDGSSYHELGTVPFLEVAGGNIVFGSEAKVSNVHFTASGEGSAAKFESEGRKISLDFSALSEEQLPKFTRDPIAIAENGTYVAKVTDDSSTDYIWLFGAGVQEQMVVADTADAIADNGELKEGVTMGTEEGTIAAQIANEAARNEQGQLVDKDGAVITPEALVDGSAEVVVTKDGSDKEEVKDIAIIDAETAEAEAESGEEVDWSTFEARIGKVGYETLRGAVNAAASGDTVVLLRDVTLAKISSSDNVALNITKDLVLEGGGHTLKTTAGRGIWVSNSNVNLTVKDLTIRGELSGTSNPLERAIQVNTSMADVTFNLVRCDFESTYYCINICSNTNRLAINAKKSTFTGWSALNSYASNSTFNFDECTLVGINKYSSQTNNYGTLVFDGGTLVGLEQGTNSFATTITLNKCTVIAKELALCEQYWISFQYGASENKAKITIDSATRFLDDFDGNDICWRFYIKGSNTIFMELDANQLAAIHANRGECTTELQSDGTYKISFDSDSVRSIYAYINGFGYNRSAYEGFDYVYDSKLDLTQYEVVAFDYSTQQLIDPEYVVIDGSKVTIKGEALNSTFGFLFLAFEPIQA